VELRTLNAHRTGFAGEVPKAKIFVCYSRKDNAFADRFIAALNAHGFEPLVDHGEVFVLHDSPTGRNEVCMFNDSWQRIQELIIQADTVILVLSPDAVTSNICAREIDFASSLQKRFVPVVYRMCDSGAVPTPLRRLKFIFYDDETRFDANMDDLAKALSTDIDWIRKHTELGAQARRWMIARGRRQRGPLLRSRTLTEAKRWLATRPQQAPQPCAATRAFISESHRATKQRRNVFTATLGACLILAVGLASLTYWQRSVAMEQRDVAEQQHK
jgi:TIR domain